MRTCSPVQYTTADALLLRVSVESTSSAGAGVGEGSVLLAERWSVGHMLAPQTRDPSVSSRDRHNFPAVRWILDRGS